MADAAGPPFLPSSMPSNLEGWGLVPCHKALPPSLKPPPVNVGAKGRAIIRDIEAENREAALRAEERRREEAAKAESVSAFNAQLRAAILTGDDVTFWRPAKHIEEVRQSLEASKVRAAETAAERAAAAAAEKAAVEKARLAATSSADDFVNALVGEASKTLHGTSRAAMVDFVEGLVQEAKQLGASGAMPAEAGAGAGAAAEGRGDGTAAAGPSGKDREARPASRGRPGTSSGGKAKPAWALTAEKLAELEAAEEEELLAFADGLDIDGFLASLEDVELEENVRAVRGDGPPPGEERKWRQNLVRAVNDAALRRAQASAQRRAAATGPAGGGADDLASLAEGGPVASVSGVSRTSAARSRAARQGSPGADGKDGGWDGSSRAAEDVGRMERSKAAAVEASDFLRENPEMRAVHSSASVRAQLAKTEGVAQG
ncbi:hypothetical protein HYH03_016202 [Edaphochlamys debaryana]|uniref:Uncharacterized protein n=1 Tax=Edaphochlamys debaryana TaxID=47281 RepID=A0A835XJ20_9CHLO|nr:hypothetical protein HYH03_016202 [Edaphochlamys debaryana]|eukprot:KAG2484998.1 hypothetical protein HYH03_016202 [Edaphochlamys debaryana]